ncbi:MAG TPA: hypothetical protein VD862_04775 [Candidatus Paceibacterota bacterium]|nr:hypothetical protein [Candidatus Paceibacterota bacterium]
MAEEPENAPTAEDAAIDSMRRTAGWRGPFGWPGATPRINLLRNKGTAGQENAVPVSEEDIAIDDLGGPKEYFADFVLLPETED